MLNFLLLAIFSVCSVKKTEDKKTKKIFREPVLIVIGV